MTSVYVYMDIEERHNGDAEDSDEPYSYQGTSSAQLDDIKIKIRPDRDGWGYNQHTFELAEEVKPGDVLYVLTAKYGTGDTFSSGEHIIPVIVLTDPYDAIEVESAIWSDYKNNPRGYGVAEICGYEIYTGTWKGYFEHLEDITIHTLTLGV